MDNVTHTLLGLTLARAGGERFGPYAAGVLVVAVNSPDIDIVSRVSSTANYLAHHRGITHSLAAAPVLALAVIGLFFLGHRAVRSSRPFQPARAFLVALGGILFGHLFMDWTTNYGTRLLLPFSSRWLAWDAVPIIDVWILLALVGGLTLPLLFRMISEEIGARRSSGRGAAVAVLILLVVWIGFRGLCHARALAVMESHTYAGRLPQRISAFATLSNPLRWRGVVETSETWEMLELNLLEDFDPTSSKTYHPPEESPALEVARRARTAQIFLDFARFPYSYVEHTDNGYEVVMRDLRFEVVVAARKGFVATIRLTPQLGIAGEEFQFTPSRPVR